MNSIFLNENILKLQKACKNNKEEMLRLFELVTYLASKKEISIEDAAYYASIIFTELVGEETIY